MSHESGRPRHSPEEHNLLLLGGGHTHLYLLARTRELRRRGVNVTLVSPSATQYYSGMAPGVMGGLYAPEDLEVDAEALVTGGGGRFIPDYAARILPEERVVETRGGERLSYDLLSANIGSAVPDEAVPLSSEDLRETLVFPTKPVHILLQARQRILDLLARGRTRVVVVGCGPAAVELAGNVEGLSRRRAVRGGAERLSVTLLCASSPLGGLPGSFQGNAAHALVRRGIEVVHNARAEEVRPEGVLSSNGRLYPADVVLLATGVKPPSLFRDSGLAVGEDGGLLVGATLQSTAYGDILGSGDCASFAPRPIRRVGVHAVREQPILYHNIRRLLGVETGALKRYRPQEHYLFALNLGDGTGVAMKWGIPFHGRTAFRVKDRLDRRFITMYQEHARRRGVYPADC